MFLGCNKSEEIYSPAVVENGKRLYETSCTACHSKEVGSDGDIGPSLYGSSFALLRTKILKGEYPDSYAPKRDTQNMGIINLKEEEIRAIYAYLNN